MKTMIKPLLLAGLMAVLGVAAAAQGMGPGGPMGQGRMMQQDRMDPAKLTEMIAKRQSELKAKLKLRADQEGAWNDFAAAMQPPADMLARANPETRKQMHDAMEKLSTPERIDHMNSMKARRDAEMAKRNEATKAFYVSLTPEQQKTFDANAMPGGRGGRHGGGPRMPA